MGTLTKKGEIMNEGTTKRDINEAQGNYTTIDLSDIILDLEGVKDNLLMICQMFRSDSDIIRGDIVDSGLFLLERTLERVTQDLTAIPYRPHRKEGITNGTK